jgi:polysaccharide biosynthesis transport protein
VNLRDYLLIFRRRKWIGIIVLLVSVGTAATLTTLATPVYQSSSSIFVGPQVVSFEGNGSNVATFGAGLGAAQQLQKTYARMIRSQEVAQKTVDERGLGVTSSYVLSSMTVNALEDTTLIEIHMRDPDPVRAQNMANGVAEAFIGLAEDLTTPRATGANPDPQPIVPVSQFESAVQPRTPVSPNPSRNLALAGVLGLVVGAGLMFAAEYLDVAVRGPEDIERLVHLPVLALIPRVTRDDLLPKRAREPAPRARVRA